MQKFFSLSDPKVIELSMNEYRTELSDSMFNVMDLLEPHTVNYLNIADHSEETPSEHKYNEVRIWLDKNVTKQNRSVYGFLAMFGDVGGLNDFLILIIAPALGLVSEKFKATALVSTLFHVSLPTAVNDTALDALNSIRPITFPDVFTFVNICLGGRCQKRKWRKYQHLLA